MIENIHFELSIPRDQALTHLDTINTLMANTDRPQLDRGAVESSQSVKLCYDLDVIYMGRVAENLQLVQTLGLQASARNKELIRALFTDTLKAIEAL